MPTYLKNADLLVEVKRARELGYITNELAKMFILMTNKYITHPWWNGYTFTDDMCGHALLALTRAGLSFDPDKSSNAFAYYTEIIKNSFLQVKKYEKKHRDIRDCLLVENGLDPSNTWLEEQMKKDADEFELKAIELAINPINDSRVHLDNIFKFD